MIEIDETRRERGRLRKIVLAAMFAAMAVLLSVFSIPVGPSRCFPFQHAVNVLAGVMLGPWWAMGAALTSSFLRNALGTGSLLAYPGSLFGALAVGLAAAALPDNRKYLAACAEPLATSLLGAWVASLLLAAAGNAQMGFLALSVAFALSSVPGAVIGTLALLSMRALRPKSGKDLLEKGADG